MAQPPANFISRMLARFLPFATQKTFQNAALGAAGTFVAEFDVGKRITDRNQFLVGAFPGAGGVAPQVAVGPYLDAGAFSAGAGSILIEFAIDQSCLYRTVTTTLVPANAFTNVSGLRITARFVRVTYTNTSGAGALAEFGTFIRST